MPVLKYKVNGEWVEVGGGSAGSIDIDLEGANAGNPNPVNADTLDGRPASDYATKIYVSAKIAEAQIGGSTGNIDLSSYVTKDDLKDFITEIPSEYVTESELNAKGYLTEHQSLDGLATINYVDNKFAEDKASIVNDVLAALPTWTGGSY